MFVDKVVMDISINSLNGVSLASTVPLSETMSWGEIAKSWWHLRNVFYTLINSLRIHLLPGNQFPTISKAILNNFPNNPH